MLTPYQGSNRGGADCKIVVQGSGFILKSLRAAHRWKPGTEFIVEERSDGILLKSKQRKGTIRWEDLVGCVNYKGPRKSIKEMDEAVAAEALHHK